MNCEIFTKVDINNNNTEYIKINLRGEEWTYSDFLLSIGIHANISVHDIKSLCDSSGVEIPKDDFVKIFFQNYTHPQVLIKVKMKNEKKNNPSITGQLSRQNACMGHEMHISKEELEKYILSSTNAYVLLKKKNSEEKKDLTDVERRAVIREAVGLLVQKYSYHPEHEHKLALANAIIKLFPQLETNNKNTGGLDLLYNREENRGYILNRLNHIRNKLYKIENYSDENSKIIKKKRLSVAEKKNKNIKQTDVIENTSSHEEDLLILKNLSTATQKDFIKNKLIKTLEYRKLSLENETVDKISEAFPFFFTSPDLILFDFNLRFPDHNLNLIDDWPKTAAVLEKVWIGFKGPSSSKIFELDEWTPSFKLFFILLNLLPQTSLGKSSAKTKRLPFEECMNRLILFRKLNLSNDELQQKDITTPYIIAKGENKKAITQFVLCIESELIPLPVHFNVTDAVDMLFKSHYIFNQKYDEGLKNFWVFISYYFFKIEEKNIPIKIKDVANKINLEREKSNNVTIPSII